MADQYQHGQDCDQRYRAAQSTSQKSGSAFEYSTPERSSWWLVIPLAALTLLTVAVLGL